MEFEQRSIAQEPTLEADEVEATGMETTETEIVIGSRHLFAGVVLIAAVAFTAVLIWRALSNSAQSSGTLAALRAELAEVGAVTGSEAVSSAPSVVVPTRKPGTRRMVLPPVRKGFKPEPEAFAVKGDPSAPVTIVEFSDYQ